MTVKERETGSCHAAERRQTAGREQVGLGARTFDTGLTPRAAAKTKATAATAARTAAAVALMGAMLCTAAPRAQQAARAEGVQAPALRAVPVALTEAPRPSIPSGAAAIWLVPDRPVKADKAATEFATAVRLLQSARYAEALPLLTAGAAASTPLAAYSAYYSAIAYLNQNRAAEARTIFSRLRADKVDGYLSEAAARREAEAAAAQGDHAGAAKIYEELALRNTASPDGVLLALGREQAAAGNRDAAAEAFARLYYEFPLSDLAATAATELDGLKDVKARGDAASRLKAELARAQRLFNAKRYQPARQAFEALRPAASGDEAEVVGLRIAECDHYLQRYQQARDGFEPFLQNASRKAEARFFHLTGLRELGQHDEYTRLAGELVKEFPDSSWAEEALNNLATHYILVDEDDAADDVFRELYQRFPQGRHAQRAAWKAGWYSYKHARYAEATALFESAAAGFPRSDYRPAYLYWSARAREAAGDRAGAQTLLRLVASDYQNSYYGRLAEKRVAAGAKASAGTVRPPAVERASATAEPATAASNAAAPSRELIGLLISLELYDVARDELLYAQRNGGDSPAVTATLAWIYNKLGDYRRGIILMKRAYPAYLSAAGTALPGDLLRVIFPIDYWTLIRRHAPSRGLDPYLVAALINQESSFAADARSHANAIGLMQLLPSTARRYARQLRIKRYAAGMLTRPEVNIQLGTAYFSELVRRLGGLHYALASYNAGEHRVAIWTTERPGVERDEFIDDIPYPETQNYVKKILGTAEDYRRLYGPGGRLEAVGDRPAVKPASAGRDRKASTPSAKAPKKKASTRPAPTRRRR